MEEATSMATTAVYDIVIPIIFFGTSILLLPNMLSFFPFLPFLTFLTFSVSLSSFLCRSRSRYLWPVLWSGRSVLAFSGSYTVEPFEQNRYGGDCQLEIIPFRKNYLKMSTMCPGAATDGVRGVGVGRVESEHNHNQPHLQWRYYRLVIMVKLETWKWS